MSKKIDKRKLKKKVWTEFSKYIRLRDSDENGWCKCCTCDYREHWKNFQAGHFIAGRNNSILFEETCVHAQCRRCNYNEGNGPEYFIFMENTYGRDEIDRLRALKHATVKFSVSELETMYEKFKELREGLESLKS